MMRVSLYKHELEVIADLTVNLTRMVLVSGSDIGISVGPQIFAELVDALYSRGQWDTSGGRPTVELDIPWSSGRSSGAEQQRANDDSAARARDQEYNLQQQGLGSGGGSNGSAI